MKELVFLFSAGIPWNSAERIISLAGKLVQSKTTVFRGLYAHCGNSYSTDSREVAMVRDETVERLLKVVDGLKSEGIQCQEVGLGSTPSCSLETQPEMAKLTEMHPGNFIFYGKWVK